MDNFIQLLNFYDANHDKYINELNWFNEYITLWSCKLDACKLVVNDQLDLYISSEKFPCQYIHEDDDKLIKKDKSLPTLESPESPSVNVLYNFIDHYGSSALTRRYRIESKKCAPLQSPMANDDDDDAEIIDFINFFTKLGKKICIVNDYTYDTTIEYKGEYIYNDKEPVIKLCVAI